jgi:hypothetical protein
LSWRVSPDDFRPFFWKERDHAREQLRGDVQSGFDQLARGERRAYDKASRRPLAELIKSRAKGGKRERTRCSRYAKATSARTGG